MGLIETFALLGIVALLATALAARVWPSREPIAREHDSEAVTHNHLHYHNHYHHQHEGW